MYLVYGVYKNADFTEGRGPMVLQFAVDTEQQAWEWVNKQPGIYGCKPPEGGWSKNPGHWDVKPIQVLRISHEIEELKKRELRKKALAKLTKAEKILLGLERTGI